jgi:hypothetical protein
MRALTLLPSESIQRKTQLTTQSSYIIYWIQSKAIVENGLEVGD